MNAPHAERTRVLHFVTGGFSGATQVALDLVKSSLHGSHIEPLLVLRRKRQTPPATLEALQAQGLPVQTVSGLAHGLSIWQLKNICQSFRPDVLVAHGFPEHLIGRYAGVWAGVPRLIHVEHNSKERYSRSKLAQARWLAQRTEHIVGVSDGVKAQLLALGFPTAKVMSIPNGIALQRFEPAHAHPFVQRLPHVVMCARFSSQKDHLTAIRAMALLRDTGLTNRLIFAGGGKPRHLARAQALAQQLGLGEQVQFLGLCNDVPALLMAHQVCLLSTHFEGMPLALIEGMAAGCAVVASDVIGVREVIDSGRNGLLVPEGDAQALATQLIALLSNPLRAAQLAEAARRDALERHGLDLMRQRYEQLLTTGAAAPAHALGCQNFA